jgi:hypothetical protein
MASSLELPAVLPFIFDHNCQGRSNGAMAKAVSLSCLCCLPHSHHLFLYYGCTSCGSTVAFLSITQWQWHVLLELLSCRCGILTIFFILNALVGDRQWHSFWKQQMLFACEVTTGPLDFLRSSCCSLSILFVSTDGRTDSKMRDFPDPCMNQCYQCIFYTVLSDMTIGNTS